MDYRSIRVFGAPLELVETYVYFDGPRTFALHSSSLDLYYFANTVDVDDESGEATTLLAAASPDRYRAVRSGVVPFREAFTGVGPGQLIAVNSRYDDDLDGWVSTTSEFDPGELTDDWLPYPDVRLDIQTATVEPFVAESLLALSAGQGRSVFALELDVPGSRITQFPVKNAGELQVAFHKEFEALLIEHLGSRSGLATELRPQLVGVEAASFVLIIALDHNASGIMEPTDVTSVVIERLNTLMTAVASGDEAAFLDVMRTHNSRVRNRFMDMLEPLSEVGSGMTFVSVLAHSDQLVRVSASAEEVASAVETIQNVEPEVTYHNVDRGVLIGLNLRTQRFEIVDSASNQNFSGSMSDEATSEANGLVVGDDSFVKARIRVEVAFASPEAADRTKYFLETIGAYEAPPSGGRVARTDETDPDGTALPGLS